MQTDSDSPRTPQSDYLLRLGTRLLQPYITLPATRAAMITGSAAEGVSDCHSDLDMTLYYEAELPAEDVLAGIRSANGAPTREWLIGSRDDGGFAEAYELHGIQVQIGHVTIAAWERDIAEVLEAFNADTPLQKAMSGTLESVTVAGEVWMDRWRRRIAAYPDGLQLAMVKQHLQFFPLWSMPHISEARDATLWRQQILVEGAFNLLGVLAGLNRRYFSTFQFKKMQRCLAGMPIQPQGCADRIERLFSQPAVDAAETLEALVGDVVGLVEQTMPAVDTTAARRRLGHRRPAWSYDRQAPGR